MKNYSFALGLCACMLSSLLHAQDKSLLTAFPELKKPIVLLPSLESTVDSLRDIQIYALCSVTKPGVVEVYVTRPFQMKATDNLRLDVTPYKKGFENNKYALLYKGKRTRVFDSRMLPQRPMMNAVDLAAVTVTPQEANRNIIYKLEGLEPGLTYFWRVLREGANAWESTEVIRIEAPTCPVDSPRRQ